MKILCLCDEGNNRSVTLAHQLKYLGHDVLAAGLRTNSQPTLDLLLAWADRVIVTDQEQYQRLAPHPKLTLWDLGQDVYPRPFNKTLLAAVRRQIANHKEELQ